MPDRELLAERVLRRLTDGERAAAIVGDLAETAAARGGGFWRSVAITGAALAWRPFALIVGCIAVQVLIGASYAISTSLYQGHPATAWPKLPAALLGISAMLLSAVALFHLARYGVRDRVARLATALTLTGWFGALLFSMNPCLILALAAMAATLAWSAAVRAWRPAFAVVCATLIASWAAFGGVVLLTMLRVPLYFPLNFAVLLLVQLPLSTRLRRRLA